MKTFKTYIAAAAAATTILATMGAAQATFLPVVDEFWIMRNGAEIFRDSFDSTLPQDETIGPNPTYGTAGETGFLTENGKLTMDPSLGTGVLIPGSTADLFTGATRRTSIAGGGNELNQAASFEVHGLFDLGGDTEPMNPGDGFGIRLNDRTPTLDGQEFIQLSYRVTSGGLLRVVLALLDQVGDTITVLDIGSLNTVSGLTPTQIEFALTNAAGSNEVGASFTVFDQFSNIMQTEVMFATIGPDPVTIFNQQDFTRAQFFSTTTIEVPLPEPGTLVIFGLGVLGLGISRRCNAA